MLIGSSAGVGRRSPEWCPGRTDQELLRGRSLALGVASEDGEAAEDGLLPAVHVSGASRDEKPGTGGGGEEP